MEGGGGAGVEGQWAGINGRDGVFVVRRGGVISRWKRYQRTERKDSNSTPASVKKNDASC